MKVPVNVALKKPAMMRERLFPWAQAQDARHEFDGVRPVAMTGGTMSHSQIIRNINIVLQARLRGTGCQSTGPDAGVATVGDAVRCPGAVIRRYGSVERTSIGLMVMERAAGGEPWTTSALTADDLLRIPEVGIEVPVTAFYEGVEIAAPEAPQS